jgi:hypothetical protein
MAFNDRFGAERVAAVGRFATVERRSQTGQDRAVEEFLQSGHS